jgi:hypothetical protein
MAPFKTWVAQFPRRIAPGGRGSEAADADRARSADHVLDDDRLAERLAHSLGHDAADRIRGPTCSERHDQRDRSRRIGLCPCNRNRSQRECKCERELFSHARIICGPGGGQRVLSCDSGACS